MSHSSSSNRVHLIFSTKGRLPCISEELQPKLWAYMAGIAKNQGFQTLVIGGVNDHVHALLILPPAMPLSKAIQFLKGSSSKWMHESGETVEWQEGYGAFSVSASQTEEVGSIYQESGRTSREKKIRRRVPGISEEIRRRVRSQARVGIGCVVPTGTPPHLHVYPGLKRWANL